jgi:hypothetical protein
MAGHAEHKHAGDQQEDTEGRSSTGRAPGDLFTRRLKRDSIKKQEIAISRG